MASHAKHDRVLPQTLTFMHNNHLQIENVQQLSVPPLILRTLDWQEKGKYLHLVIVKPNNYFIPAPQLFLEQRR